MIVLTAEQIQILRKYWRVFNQSPSNPETLKRNEALLADAEVIWLVPTHSKMIGNDAKT
jgi:hypothetical protein